MESINRLDNVHDPIAEGRRALDEKTDEFIEDVGQNGMYDLVIRGIEYPYTEQNTAEENMADWAEPGVHEKGEIPLAGINVEGQDIAVFYSSIERFEGERRQQAERLAQSIDQVNEAYGTDWSALLYLQPERAVYNEPEVETESGVMYTPGTMETIRSSEAFSDLSQGLFAGWLELSPEELLKRK